MNRHEPIRVLVIDDSAFSRQTITRMLETSPLVEVVGSARDGEEALRKTLELEPDLITLDLEMPRMDGFTFLRLVMAKCPTPVIVISGRAGRYVAVSKSVPVFDKPIDEEGLLEEIRNILGQ